MVAIYGSNSSGVEVVCPECEKLVDLDVEFIPQDFFVELELSPGSANIYTHRIEVEIVISCPACGELQSVHRTEEF